jgi:hypothetical protein
MKSQSELIKDLSDKAKSFSYVISRDDNKINFIDSDGILRLSYLTFSKDYTLSNEECKYYLSRIVDKHK